MILTSIFQIKKTKAGFDVKACFGSKATNKIFIKGLKSIQ
jgi:hypothetical protein